jgi:hypothetical protein
MNRPCLSSGRAGQTRIGRRRLAGGRATRLGAALAAVAALAVAGCSTSPGQASGQVNMAETGPAAAAAPDNPNAPGFWYGTDSATIPITSQPPYREPVVSGRPPYGGYIGMAGNWSR